MADNELASLDALLRRFPALRCPKCGHTQHRALRITVDMVWGVTETDPKSKVITTRYIEEKDPRDHLVACGGCFEYFPLPADWKVEHT